MRILKFFIILYLRINSLFILAVVELMSQPTNYTDGEKLKKCNLKLQCFSQQGNCFGSEVKSSSLWDFHSVEFNLNIWFTGSNSRVLGLMMEPFPHFLGFSGKGGLSFGSQHFLCIRLTNRRSTNNLCLYLFKFPFQWWEPRDPGPMVTPLNPDFPIRWNHD